MTMQRYDIFASQLYANGHRPKKSAKKLWITYKIVNNLSLDGRKVPFLGAITTGPQLLNEGRAAVDPSHQVVDSHVALGIREKFVGEVVLADVVFLHDRCFTQLSQMGKLKNLKKLEKLKPYALQLNIQSKRLLAITSNDRRK